MRFGSIVLGLFLLPVAGFGHHSVAAFFDRSSQTEIEGVVSALFWRNPHVGITLLVENGQGAVEEWQLEGGTFNDLMRAGFDPGLLAVGDRLRVAGAPSRRGENAVYIDYLTLPNGAEFDIRGTGEATTIASRASQGDISATGIFRVWSNSGTLYALRSPLALTSTARMAIAGWDPVRDDPGLRCEPPGMPNAILNPYPIEFVDLGESILIRIEEWDAVRTVHVDGGTGAEMPAPSAHGYSVGRWEGDTLIVETTQINWPYLDDKGAPQSENVSIVERFTLSDNNTRLSQQIVVIDPEYLTEPAIWDAEWVWKPGVRIRPFECTLR
jgi:hypothetical protein